MAGSRFNEASERCLSGTLVGSLKIRIIFAIKFPDSECLSSKKWLIRVRNLLDSE